jgi:hypothetical protein
VSAVLPSAHLLAAGLDPNSVSPGLLGFIVVVIIGIATWLLARSMTKQLRKLDAGRVEQQESDEQPEPDPKRGPEPNGAH